jgi:hypothetical protein
LNIAAGHGATERALNAQTSRCESRGTRRQIRARRAQDSEKKEEIVQEIKALADKTKNAGLTSSDTDSEKQQKIGARKISALVAMN